MEKDQDYEYIQKRQHEYYKDVSGGLIVNIDAFYLYRYLGMQY